MDPKLLKIKVKLAKDLAECIYSVNNSNKKIEMLVGSQVGDIIHIILQNRRKESRRFNNL